MKLKYLIFFIAVSCQSSIKDTKDVELKGDEKCKLYFSGLEYIEVNYKGCGGFNDGSLDSLIQILEMAVSAECQESDLYYKLYYCYKKKQEYRKAEKCISTAIKFDPEDCELYYWKGELNMKLGEIEEATAAYRQYIGFDNVKNLATGYYRYGALLYAVGDTGIAEEYRAKSLSLRGETQLRSYDDYIKTFGVYK